MCLPNSKLCTQINKKLCYKTRDGLWNFSKISSFQNYPYSLPFFQKYHNHPIDSSSFHHLPRLIILLLPRKVVRTSFLKIQIESYVRKREPQMIQIRPLKKRRKKEVKENPNSVVNGRFQCLVANGRFQCFVANGKFQCLVANRRFQCLMANGRFQCFVANGRFKCFMANGRFQAWWPMEGSNALWPMEGSKLGGQWKVLMFGVLWKEKEKHVSHLFSLSPQQILLKPFFSFTNIKVLLYHDFKLLLYAFFFSLTYKLQPNISMYKVFHTFIVELILIEFFFPFLEFMASNMTTSHGPQITQVNEKSPSESSLDLILTQHPCDENLELRKVRLCSEVEPLQV